ncbi:SatD family protein [Aeromicrobium sp. NPDC092404]|uniref:SatD family protein n=1 Tax=Aeromicrobium sp. NPDC092404 TaxID=3154976 RepID=UPI0034200CD9
MNHKASQRYAVIGDLVDSRSQPSRARAQEQLLAALEVVNAMLPSVQPLEPTIGDELQAVYEDLSHALQATVLVRLALPETMDCRFGIGVGEVEIVGASNYGLTQDGKAWWSAREAIDIAKARHRQLPGLRTWIVRDGAERGDIVNSYLLVRDELVSGFDGRQRRIALAELHGRSLSQIAADEGISTSAVSQRHRSGISALLESIREVPR